MKNFYPILVSALMSMVYCIGSAQTNASLSGSLANAIADSNRVKLLIEASEQYYFNKPDSCLYLANQAIELARKINYTRGEITGLNRAGEALRFLGDFPAALEVQFKALELNRQVGSQQGEAVSLGFIGLIYSDLREYKRALHYLNQAQKIYDQFTNPIMISFNLSNMGYAYEGMDLLDSALYFQQSAQKKSEETSQNEAGNLKVMIAARLGIIYGKLNNRGLALHYFQNALQSALLINDKVNPSKILSQIAESFIAIHQRDSAFYYARQAYANGNLVSQKLQVLEASKLLVKLFRETHNSDSVILYQDIGIAMNDSLFGAAKLRQLQILALKEQEKQQEILQKQEQYKNKTKMFALVTMLTVFLLLALILYRNNRQKQKVNRLLLEQKNEIQHTLTELKSTQAQLIQSEKMASLGELTAGIAHEIQNPLNFVNNFSEVNHELIEELKSEKQKVKSERNEKLEEELIENIRENSEKINHHGKRADAIVKSMLQHSRGADGGNKKEPTDINALADEFFRLAYHGLKAKDKTFNSKMESHFDSMIGKINIIPQDIGRVLLNLINNAFYAVHEKKKILDESHPPIATCLPTGRIGTDRQSFDPLVSVTTLKNKDHIEIKVKDNGLGIPQNLKDKIFQPFFTTKPPGQGTGLGLSLAYDIVKAHGGDFMVETKEGQGTEFIVQLPII